MQVSTDCDKKDHCRYVEKSVAHRTRRESSLVDTVRRRAEKAAEYYHKNVTDDLKMNTNNSGHNFQQPLPVEYYKSYNQSQVNKQSNGSAKDALHSRVPNVSSDAYYKNKLREGFVDLRNTYNSEKNGRFTTPSPRGGNQQQKSLHSPRQNQASDLLPRQTRSDYLYSYDSSNDGQSSGSNRSGEAQRGIIHRSNSQLGLDQGDYIEDGYLRRHYGSTNSLDMTSATTDSFFDMLKEYRSENLDQRAPPPPQIHDVLRGKVDITSAPQDMVSQRNVAHSNGSVPSENSAAPNRSQSPRLREKIPSAKESRSAKKNRAKSMTTDGATGLFRKLRGTKSDAAADASSKSSENSADGDSRLEEYIRRKALVHYDCQSVGVNLHNVIKSRNNLHKRRNTTTGASAASSQFIYSKTQGGNTDTEESDPGDGKNNDLVLSCSFFRNEIGGEEERIVSLTRQTAQNRVHNTVGGKDSKTETLMRKPACGGIAILDTSPNVNGDLVPSMLSHNGYVFEQKDLGAYYYRNFFFNYEHQNYFGIDEHVGPVAISIRREKTDEKDSNSVKAEGSGPSHHYRLIVRTSELTALRGAVTEDAIPSSNRLSNSRGVPVKDLLEYIAPQMDLACLRLANSGQKTAEQLLKLDEQGITNTYKIGIMYCQAGQSTEEEIYNSEHGSPAFDEFLDLIGQRVRLKGFDKYRAGLDNKTDTTGLHSVYTTAGNNEIMFHVSTLLPYTPNNRQQLLRKRHIGNDIVTIVFQEPGSLPFTPKTVRSHFQHVFVVVKVHNPCTEHVRYSIAVTRSKDVPPFGPAIPVGCKFKKSPEFVSFLLTKLINGENAAHKSEKFMAMATRTRQEYLKDLAANYVTNTTLESGSKLSKFSLGSGRKKDKSSRKTIPDAYAKGAIVWNIQVEDFGQSTEIDCFLGLASETIVVIEEESNEVIFTIPCKSVIGWSSHTNSLRLYYDRGECIVMKTHLSDTDDIQEITSRLPVVTQGCETVEMTLRRNGLGQLGFHVIYEGLVSEVEPYGFAWQAGIRQGSRLVEICKVATATLTQDQVVDLLRTSVTVKVVVIPPLEDGSPRRGCEDMYSSQSSLITTSSADNNHLEDGFTTHDSSSLPRDYRNVNAIAVNLESRFSPQLQAMHTRQSSGHSSHGSHSPRPQQPYPLPRGWQRGGYYDKEPPKAPGSDSESWNLNHNTGTGSSGYHSDSGSAFTSSGYNTHAYNSHSGSAFNPVGSRPGSQNPPGLPPRPDYRSSEATSTEASQASMPNTPSKRQLKGTLPTSQSPYKVRYTQEGSSPVSSRSSSPKSSARYLALTLRASDESLSNRLRPGVSVFSKTSKPIVPVAPSNFQEELMRLIDPNVSEAEIRSQNVQKGESNKPRLQRTLSEESIRDFGTVNKRNLPLDTQFGSDVIFTTAIPARVRQHEHDREQSRLSPSGSLELRRRKPVDPYLPLPDATSDIDWSNLVDAATKAIEGVDLCSKITSRSLDEMPDIRSATGTTKPVRHEGQSSRVIKTSKPSKPTSSTPWRPSGTTTSQRMLELEERCNHLQHELDQERQEKQDLLAEVDKLRQDNVRLQEESQRAASQLRRFTEWFFQTIDKQ